MNVSTKMSGRTRAFPNDYSDNVEFEKGMKCCCCSMPMCSKILFVGTLFSFIGYTLGFIMTSVSLAKANKDDGEIVLWTGDSSNTIRAYQQTKICDNWFETPDSLKAWLVFSTAMTINGIIYRVLIMYYFSGLAFFTKERTR